MIKTTMIMNVTITKIMEGDHGKAFTEEDLRNLSAKLKEEYDVDNVVVRNAKTFVMEEKDAG